MRSAKALSITALLLVLIGGGVFAYLYQTGYFTTKQVALRQLEKQGISAHPSSVLARAAKGDLPALNTLAQAEVDFHGTDEEGRTALHHALTAQHYHLLPLLRREGSDLDARDQQGNTPLSLLLEQGQQETASLLIQEGASPNYTLPNGEIALPGYYQAERLNDFTFLLEHQANPNSPALDGQTPLALALQDGKGELACRLLEKGADPKSLIFGEPALTATLKGYKNWNLEPEIATRVIGTLLVTGADPEEGGSDGLRPIQLALKSDLNSSLELLFPRIQNVNDCLWLAIEQNNAAAIENLLGKGTPVEEIGPDGDTPLIHAIRHGKTDLLSSLLSADADPNQFALEGQRALFFALAIKQSAAVTTLLSHQNRPDLTAVMEYPASEEFRALYGSKGFLDWYSQNESGLNALMVAIMLKNLPATEQLLALGMDKHQGTAAPGVVYPIQMAAENGDVKMQQLIIGVPYHDEEQERKFTIDLSEQKVHYYKNGKLQKTSRISSGKRGYRTQPGEYVITDKTRHKRSNIYDQAEMPYFQRFSCKAIGFHEGNTYSRFASHGCIRLPRSTAQYFWKETQLGDRVTIQP